MKAYDLVKLAVEAPITKLMKRVEEEVGNKEFEIAGTIAFETSREEFQKTLESLNLWKDQNWYDKAIVVGDIGMMRFQQVYFLKFKDDRQHGTNKESPKV